MKIVRTSLARRVARPSLRPSVRSLAHLFAGACLAPLIAFAQAQGPAGQAPATQDPAAMAEALQMRDFVASYMHGQVAATCASHGDAQSGELDAAYQAWKAPLEQSIALGEGVLLRRYPDFGGSKDTLRAEMEKRYRGDTEPAVVADLVKACDARVSLLKTGVPVAFSGRTGTDPTLRMDIYNQALMAVSCWQIDSIAATVVKADPPGTSEERWIMDGCGKPVPVSVTYSPRAGGSTDFVVGVESGALIQADRTQRLEAARRLIEQAKARKPAP